MKVRRSRYSSRPGTIFILFFTVSLVLCPALSFSGQFRVSPIRLEFGGEVKSGVVTVINEGDENLNIQVNAAQWIQDEEGKDRYEETSDIIFFPKIIILKKGEQRVVRAGIKMPRPGTEKTYRLFIEEIPHPKEAGAGGTNVAIAIRFGVPIFVRPLETKMKGEIVGVEMSGGTVGVIVRNTGNVHFVISSLNIRGRDGSGEVVFSRNLSGWYLLSGASRRYETSVPKEKCGTLKTLEVEIETDGFTLERNLDIEKGMCSS